MRSLIIISVLLTTVLAVPVQAAKVAGVKLDDSVQISADTPKLMLNGAGIRKTRADRQCQLARRSDLQIGSVGIQGGRSIFY